MLINNIQTPTVNNVVQNTKFFLIKIKVSTSIVTNLLKITETNIIYSYNNEVVYKVVNIYIEFLRFIKCIDWFYERLRRLLWSFLSEGSVQRWGLFIEGLLRTTCASVNFRQSMVVCQVLGLALGLSLIGFFSLRNHVQTD